MADAGDDVFLLGDDFEAILDLLDEDEALYRNNFHLLLVKKVQSIEIFTRTYCIYSNKRGCAQLIFRVADAALI